MIIKTDLPTLHGERQFADNITSCFKSDDYWFWFNVQIPRAGSSKEVDSLIYSKFHKIFFVIEVKGFLIDHINSIEKGKMTLNSGDQRGNPWLQASDNAKLFSSTFSYFIRAKHLNINSRVYFSPIVSLPMISRKDFIEHFVESHKENIYLNEMSNSTLFEEDFINEKTLKERIEQCLKFPIYGLNFYNTNNTPLNNDQLDSFSKIFFPEIKSKYNKTYDSNVLRNLEKECLKILSEIKPSHKVLIEGYAGTGKTFIGFNLARKLAAQGKKVLFTCYNKTLATDLNRILRNEPVFRNDAKVQANLFIKDIFDILVDLNRIFSNKDNIMSSYIEKRKYFESDIRNNTELTEYDKWAIDIIDRVLIQNEMHNHLYKYDFIVADETQDFKEYMFDLLDILVHKNNDIAYIFGKSQVLYLNDEAPEYNDLTSLRSILKNDIKENYIERRRVFRTTDMSFLIAQSYLECFPRSSDAINFISDKIRKKTSDNLSLDFVFERKGGNLPKLIYTNGESRDLTSKLTKTLEEIFNRNKDLKGVDSDIMILIPHYNYIKSPIVDALKILNKKYIDYTLDANKRIVFSDDEVRICSYYSARGLEGNFILIIGFNYFEIPIIERGKANIINDLGYIVLSRAIYDTYFLTISEEKERQLIFLEEIVEHFKI